MKKLNCWEFNKCGREPGGASVKEFGVCPASTEKKLDGILGGNNAGRACWVVGGTLCDGKIQGSFSKKYDNCMECDFCRKVKEEERSDWHPSATLFMMVSFSGKVQREL
jgi:hypothetical protein